MYKVVLIDDEPVILRGLKMLIDWAGLAAEIVGVAENGEAGLAEIELKKPDIIVSDIAMPGMSGIELLKEINGRGLNIKVILLSGYQEFSYAREAVRYGAVDYLLKPVGATELAAVIERTVQQIRLEESVHVLKKRDSSAEVCFQKIIQQKNQNDSLEDIFRQEEVHSGAICVGLKILVKNSIHTEENQNLIRFEIYEFIQQYLEKHKIGTIIRKEYNVCYFILFTGNDREKIQEQCDQLVNEIKQNHAADIIVGAGGWQDCRGRLLYLYKTARFALELYYFEEKRYIDYEEIDKEYHHSLEEYQKKLKEIKQNIIVNHHSEDILPDLMDCLKLLGSIHYGNKNAVINSTILFSSEIFTTLRECELVEKSEEDDNTDFLEEVRKKSTFKALLLLFQDYYGQLFLKIRLLYRNKESSEIVRIKNYIQEHFKENITLEDLADYIGMNTSYMSVFFKKETGQNFKAYLTEVRMKEALKLVNATDMNSYEIAEATGYRDVKQFREKFKEIYGVSPQQYRKRGNI